LSFGRRDATTKALEFLNAIEKNNGKASKWDLIKVAGNEAAFRRWVTKFLQKHKFLEETTEGRKTIFKKTEKGETLHQTLRDWHFIVAFKRLSGKRLKSEM
jgi:predicted transcriptional regulator